MYELLKQLHIPFRHRWLVDGREVDFIVGKYAIEINGHEQDEEKTHFLANRGYIPVQLDSNLLLADLDKIKTWLRIIHDTRMA